MLIWSTQLQNKSFRVEGVKNVRKWTSFVSWIKCPKSFRIENVQRCDIWRLSSIEIWREDCKFSSCVDDLRRYLAERLTRKYISLKNPRAGRGHKFCSLNMQICGVLCCRHLRYYIQSFPLRTNMFTPKIWLVTSLSQCAVRTQFSLISMGLSVQTWDSLHDNAT